MKDVPVLETERLILSAPVAADIPSILKYGGNPNIAATTLNIPHPYYERDAIRWLASIYAAAEAGTGYTFGLHLRENGEFIGGTGLHLDPRHNRAELGYWVAEPYWGRGLVTESARRLFASASSSCN